MTEKRAGGPQAGRRIGRRGLISGVALGAAGLSGAAFVGCGSSRQGARSAAPSGSAQNSPKAGGKLALHVSTDPYSWDTSIAGKSAPNGEGMALAYETLVGFEQGPDAKYGEIVVLPRLASKRETQDGQTYTFQLRPGLKFSPLPPVNGRDLTADDVKWSYEYATRTGGVAGKKLPQGQFDRFFEGVESVQASNASTAVVRFKQPFVPYLNYAGYAIDRDEFIKSLDGGVGGWGLAGAFPDTFTPEETKQSVQFDPKKSKQLLSAAGYSSGLDFDCPYPGHDYGDTYIAAGDVDSFLYADYYSTSKANYNFNKDPKLDAMLDAQRREFDAARRQQLVRDAVRYISEQGFGFGLDSRTGYEFWQPGLRQYAPQYGVLRVPLAESWLSR